MNLRMLLLFLCAASPAVGGSEPMEFWAYQRRGANGDVGDVSDEWFKAAAGFGIEWVRLSPSRITSAGRDPLIGNADKFTTIPPSDLKQLIYALDLAQKHGVSVVLTTFSLPGCRWKQHNEGKFDYRLWKDHRFHEQSAAFWRELAVAVKDHPAVVGFNPLNEPHPEREQGFEEPSPEFETWRQSVKGTAADLNVFYSNVVQAIRSVDSTTPILLEGCFHASPSGLNVIKPLDEPRVLYSFHYYSPWEYTTTRVNKGRFQYPTRMPSGAGEPSSWSNHEMAKRLESVKRWAEKNHIPSRQIVFSEFGCGRRVDGAAAYLSDVIDVADKHKWHWAFYSFRSSDWDSMDYELGTAKLGWKYWQERENGTPHDKLVQRKDNPLWEVIAGRLNPRLAGKRSKIQPID
jgi:hypothetical protein